LQRNSKIKRCALKQLPPIILSLPNQTTINNDKITMNYRPEIDGLRAVAVLPVIMFHAGFHTFSGGFVGVDVFFVISGYLITSIILSEMEARKFRLIYFYERRVRRLLPALLVIMIASIPAAWVWMTPDDMKDFSHSLIAVSTFWSNILFWKTSGYFDAAGEMKPLFHTWSLAVEEQYYILFPLFLIVAWRFFKKLIVPFLILIAIISISAAHWGTYFNNSPVASFYLLPTRGWEILLGAFIAFYLNRYKTIRVSHSVNQILSSFGLAMIAASIFLFSGDTPVPSLLTLLPTLGTVFVICFTNDRTFVFKLLANKIIVSIGLISYSLYLWHQPLFVFARHALVEPPTIQVMLFLTALTFPLAFITWKFIECPVRARDKISRTSIFAVSAGSSVILISVGLLGHFQNGFESQWVKRQLESASTAYHLMKDRSGGHRNKPVGKCQFMVNHINSPAIQKQITNCFKMYGPGFAVLGDSHAQNLFGVAIATAEKPPFVFALANGACRPHNTKFDCFFEDFYRFLKANPKIFKHVIYEQAGFYLLRTKNLKSGYRGMIANIPMTRPVKGIFVNKLFVSRVKTYLERLTPFTKVTWFGSHVEPHFPKNLILKKGCRGQFKLRENQLKLYLDLDKYIAKILTGSAVSFLSQNTTFKFDFSHDFMDCKAIYWADGDHFSAAGEYRFGQRFNLFRAVSE
jgi:peptidoglycan/LPS O-acetylase OafA/YrhL